MNLSTLFDYAIEREPNKLAVVDGDKQYTYYELNDEVNRIAFSLQKLGVRKHDRVAVLLKNRIEAVVFFWAVQKLGAIFTPINISQSQEIIHYCLSDVEVRFIVYEKASETAIDRKKLVERPLLISIDGRGDITYQELLDKGSNQCAPAEISDDDLSVILYTSGTSGNPKGVPRSHKNEYASTVAHILQCQYQRYDHTLGIMPLYHTMGLRSLLCMMMLNGTLVIVREFDAYEELQLIEQEKVNCLYLIPTMYHDMVSLPEAKNMDFSTLHTIAYAGAPMSSRLIMMCDEIFNPENFINHYGSTEIYTFTTCPNVREKPGCVGKAGVHQRIRMIEADPNRLATPNDIVSDGDIGEIIVHSGSPESFKGYWNKPDTTGKSIMNNWYYTGDLGYKDRDGDLFIVGRIDEMILSAGENIYPQEIEAALTEHPKVQETVVLGEEDERWGQVVVAFIVPSDQTLTINELDQFCKKHLQLSNYKRPRRYIFLPALPKTAVGKIMRKKLKPSV
jgi:2-furoate---CoA ligase